MARCASRNDGHRLEGGAGGSPGGKCSDAAAVQSETDPDHDRGRERGPIGRGRGRLKNALRWHGLNASTRHLQPDARGAAETLLAAASEHAALVVMGAYGHSRLREWVFGASPKACYIAEVPVLMMH